MKGAGGLEHGDWRRFVTDKQVRERDRGERVVYVRMGGWIKKKDHDTRQP